MKKDILLMILFTVILSINLVTAAPPIKTFSSSEGLVVSPNLVNYIAQNTLREWEIHVLNSSKLITSGVTCTLHIYEENKDGGHIYKNTTSTIIDEYDLEIIVPPAIQKERGQYSFKAFCNTTGLAGLYEGTYYITKSGNPPADDIFTAVIYLLFIISIIVLFYSFFMNIFKIATAETTVYDVLISIGSYILLIVVNYLGGEYIIRTFVEDITGQLLTITAFTNVLLPLISLIIVMFIKATQKKKPLSAREFSGFR